MGMLLTRTHCYVAEFGLSLGPSAGQKPTSVLTLPGSRPGAPPTGHRAQTPWRPLLPQPMHCKHPQTRTNTMCRWGMRDIKGRRRVKHPIAGKRLRKWEKHEILMGLSILCNKSTWRRWLYNLHKKKKHSRWRKWNTKNEAVLTCYCMKENGG